MPSNGMRQSQHGSLAQSLFLIHHPGLVFVSIPHVKILEANTFPDCGSLYL